MENQILKTTTTDLGKPHVKPGLQMALQTIQAASGATLVNIQDCFKPEFLSIRKLSMHEASLDKLKFYLSDQIIQANEFLNLPAKMTIPQVGKTVELIIKQFPMLNVADVKLCIENGLSGKYGKIYSRLDGQVVLEWFTNYTEERIETAELLSETTAQGVVTWPKADNGLNTPENVKKMYDNYRKWDAENTKEEKKREEASEQQQRIRAATYAAEQELNQLTEPDYTGMTQKEKEAAYLEYKNQRTEILKKHGVL